MKGHTSIIATLNRLLAGELTAIDQYFIHSEMLSHWGLHRLADRLRHEVDDERGHARQLIARILFLEGVPDMTQRRPLAVGKDVPHILKNDLAVELAVVADLRAAIAECEAAQDYVTRDILLRLLDDTEVDHAHWLEQQLRLLQSVGLENYLQAQMEAAPAAS